MKLVFELAFEETLDVETIRHIGSRITDAISGHGPTAYPRMLVELQPTYLEIPLSMERRKMKSDPLATQQG